MKIQRFQGKGIRGYLDFDISFNSSLSFLIGINGTGKTTVLKLISGLLTPSYLNLVQIDFSEISLTCALGAEDDYVAIACKKNADSMLLSYHDKLGKIIDQIEIADILRSKRRIRNQMSHLELERHEFVDFDSFLSVQKIKALPQIIVLGLNRRIGDLNRYYDDSDLMFYYKNKSIAFDNMVDSVDSALCEIEDMIHTRVRETAHSQYKLSEVFRKKVFSESFKVESHLSIPLIEFSIELPKLEERRRKLNDAIEKLGVQDLSEQFEGYFDSIRDTLKTLSKISSLDSNNQMTDEYMSTLLLLMIKYVQIEKIDNIIKYANSYSENILQLKEPIIRFVDSVNLFLKETGKEIEVDDKGELCVKIKGSNKSNTIFELSSGEKQLVVMLAHIAMHKKNKYPSVFIVDEPELSLHISWQEIFVDALLTASPNTQYILATHAPAIISNISRRANCIDLTPKN